MELRARPWARATLAKHASDPRPERYTPRELEAAKTGDEIWNAAQRQLVTEGIHSYLRMLWGKKILDPNSYAGILWTLGLFDHPWGPERPIFGTVRYMSSAATRRKLRMTRYLAKFS